jgi:hypothetical protein
MKTDYVTNAQVVSTPGLAENDNLSVIKTQNVWEH